MLQEEYKAGYNDKVRVKEKYKGFTHGHMDHQMGVMTKGRA